MSHRPRLAGDGRLRVPEKVVYDQDDFVHVHLSDDVSDPFEWTGDRLLLSESFVRTDFRDKRAARLWLHRHGAVDRLGVVGRTANSLDFFGKPEPPSGEIWEHVVDVEAEQANVRWHLTTLERLSTHREDRAWDPSWGHVVIDGPDGDLVVGGPDAGAELMHPLVVDSLRRDPTLSRELRQRMDEQTRLHAATGDWPTVAVGETGWVGYWRGASGDHGVHLPEDARRKARVLGTTWDETVELASLLIEPYVAEAVERRFAIAREPRETHIGERAVLVPREERTWRSILPPIYLQLFEAVRRITEGEPGAATCRECGRPFLVLDARRRFFCNDKERTRFTQRERRRRLQDDDGEAAT